MQRPKFNLISVAFHPFQPAVCLIMCHLLVHTGFLLFQSKNMQQRPVMDWWPVWETPRWGKVTRVMVKYFILKYKNSHYLYFFNLIRLIFHQKCDQLFHKVAEYTTRNVFAQQQQQQLLQHHGLSASRHINIRFYVKCFIWKLK